MVNIFRYPARENWSTLIARPAIDVEHLEGKVMPILKAVKETGDKALKKFTEDFDHVQLNNFAVSKEEIEAAEQEVSNDLKAALNIARINIEKFHLSQKETSKKIETMPGVYCWRKSIPITKVGLYIPGGTAPLFSTVLMLGIPAMIAGCEEIIVCSPPNKTGNLDAAIIYTCHLLGIKKIFKVGGAQAIAAMAYGTESIPGVYKIFGPGNQYVTCAKQLVNRQGIAIDMPAGPSEVTVLGDNTCVPSFVAADLLSQAEHGVDSQVMFITDNEEILREVVLEVALQTEALSRKDIILKSLRNSRFILLENIDDAVILINEYAPEHLILQVRNAEDIAVRIHNAGSVFLGNYTPEAAGDYASGTNHTLPTNGHAKAMAGVSLDSFIKKITYQEITKEGIKILGPVVELMAAAENLEAHKNAVTLRMRS